MPQLSRRPHERAPRWVPLTTAPDQLTAEIWRGLLESEGIPAMLAPGDAASYLGLAATPCRLLVPDAVLEVARRALDGELWAAERPLRDEHA
jgi:hypothetical protein